MFHTVRSVLFQVGWKCLCVIDSSRGANTEAKLNALASRRKIQPNLRLSVLFQYCAKPLSVSFQISFQSIFSFISFSIKKAL
jgi:hypothetical protein